MDYLSKDMTPGDTRKVQTWEIHDTDELHKFYKKCAKKRALRVIHVQNSPWATRFLMKKFNIDSANDLVGTDFGRWAKYEKPKRRGQGSAAKPIPSGKAFRPQHDPWRGLSRTAFGLDYLKHYERHKIVETHENKGWKMMELNHYDSQDNPAYGYDIMAQRVSVYVQLALNSDGEPGVPANLDIRNPYEKEEWLRHARSKNKFGPSSLVEADEGYIPILPSLDNGSTIIIFDHSLSGWVNDALIGARDRYEANWRRINLFLPPEDRTSPERMAIECLDIVLKDVFKALSGAWEKYINLCETHLSILEDKIYENPADESRAPELWTNSSQWLKVERLLTIHTDIVKEMRNHLREVAHENPNDDDPWMATTLDELEKLSNQFTKGVVTPTANLSDLMYKSVGIRDARHSLQLGLSMWRLSWITFIFLPLTFVCGFFGMNVDTFEGNPSIKWWFITTVPLFVLVIAIWYGVKHTLLSQRQSPLRRGAYENLYHDLMLRHPQLWGRLGPRQDITPSTGWVDVLKWDLINRWFAPERTVAVQDRDPVAEELGSWGRCKHYLVRRWLPGLELIAMKDEEFRVKRESEETAAALARGEFESFSAVSKLVLKNAPMALAEGNPTAAKRVGRLVGGILSTERSRTPSPAMRHASPVMRNVSPVGSTRSSGSEGIGIMVEEKSDDDLEGEEGGDINT